MNKQNSVGSAEPALGRILSTIRALSKECEAMSTRLHKMQDDDESIHYLLLTVEGVIKSQAGITKEG